ncbi:MAG: 3',5'-cyclic AMP phosphodiesterase CpdA [Yoonia sp.]|jgi:3',5'-cyclic AMP phosphodiesterase CpdA
MTKIIVITDIHITSVGDTIIGLDPMMRFQSVLDAALTDHPDAKMLILLGDLTHHGTVDQYQRLCDAVADCPIPVIPMLGNHDKRDAFYSVFADAPQDIGGFAQHQVDLDHHRILSLDTLDGPPYPTGHHAGRLCADRLAWLKDGLDGAGSLITLVFSHHPPFDTGIVGMDAIKLANGDLMLDLLAKYPRTHLFCGHIHRTISGSLRGVPWTMFKSHCHQGVLDLTNPDSSLSIDEAGAYGVLLLTPDGVVAHSQDVGANGLIQLDQASA